MLGQSKPIRVDHEEIHHCITDSLPEAEICFRIFKKLFVTPVQL